MAKDETLSLNLFFDHLRFRANPKVTIPNANPFSIISCAQNLLFVAVKKAIWPKRQNGYKTKMNMKQRQEEIIASTVLRSLQVVEKQMDENIAKLDEKLTLGETDLEELREQRKVKLEKQKEQVTNWKAKGHGTYTEITTQKEFFSLCKSSQRIVVHFFRRQTRRCEIVDKHLANLSREYLETRFLKIDAEKSPFLVERLKIWMMPSIVLVKDGKTEHTICGFDEFGGSDDFSSVDVANVLFGHGLLLAIKDDKKIEDLKKQYGATEKENFGGNVEQSKVSKAVDEGDDDW
eukprot:snap_masked-scaffold_22-processed-gene-3.14-mRNA-1 protein AED:0.11 eAED:0.11 QI:0/0/0/0.5/1/1/2/0/290